MKPFKLLACLVTLSIACGHPLSADTSHDFREWTDNQGRKIVARLVALPNSDTVEIERKGDKAVYAIPRTMFSMADRAYLKEIESPSIILSKVKSDLKEPDDSLWTLLSSAGTQPTYNEDIKFDLMVELINQRFAVRGIKTPDGKSLSIRIEPSDITSRISIPKDLPRMRMDEFVREVLRMNKLSLKLDSAGMIVLVDTISYNYLTSYNEKVADLSFYDRDIK